MLNIDSQTFLYIIIAILVLSNIYLFYKTRKIEGFATTEDDLEKAITKIYTADIDAIRNLSNIAKDMTTNNDTLTIPAATVKINRKLQVEGDVELNGNVKFTNKNSNIMETLPTFMIIMWLGNVDPAVNNGKIVPIPKGWALCDGGTYRIGRDGYAEPGMVGTDLATPDLRGRFLVGAGQGNGLTKKNLSSMGGSETHTLTEAEMPSHNHKLPVGVGDTRNNRQVEHQVSMYWNYYGWGPRDNLIHNTGGNQPHNNMPPWYAINYIMKL